ncbi:Interference hedgehog [Armadillidium vulgare]|nr:Interference hedgehog [Armadillidium vulgare]
MATLLFFLTLMSQIIPLIIMIINEFPPIPFPYTAVQENYEYFSKYYEVPWCRSAPWFIGIWTGIILVKYPHKLKRLTKVQVVIGYVVVTVFFILLMFGFISL